MPYRLGLFAEVGNVGKTVSRAYYNTLGLATKTTTALLHKLPGLWISFGSKKERRDWHQAVVLESIRTAQAFENNR